jgi:putative PIN family toxin of toxin-antitoxin system
MQPLVSIIDTNIVIAGLITSDTGSPPAQILDAMLNGGILYLMSEDLLKEYASVLRRPRLVRLHSLSDVEIDALLTELVANAIWHEPAAQSNAPDPGDNHLWALLNSSPECLLVTGDLLLIDKPPRSGAVISARAFAELYLRTIKT